MLSLLKYLTMPWERARGYLKEDLETIESTLNVKWAAVFDNNDQLRERALNIEILPESERDAGAKLALHRFCGGL